MGWVPPSSFVPWTSLRDHNWLIRWGSGMGRDRPDLSPQALTAAYNLPRYDAVYTRLREEYIQVSVPRAKPREDDR